MSAEFMIEKQVVDAGEARLHCLIGGPEDGALVVLLHGFPACAETWRAQLVALAAAGFRVVAPDQRGYGESDKPAGVASYSVPHLVADVIGILDSFKRAKAFVVGHDFGGGVAWATAMAHPDRVEKLAILNAVHPIGFERQMKHWSQLKKSWYLFFFQLPWLPEWLLARKDFAFLRSSLRDDDLRDETIDMFVEALRHPGSLHAAVNWYRASFRDGARGRLVPKKVELPSLMIWGDRERHLDPELATPPADWVSSTRVEHIAEGSHWVHHDAPEKVSTLLVEHFEPKRS
jgi:epoxide hydrolase 4